MTQSMGCVDPADYAAEASRSTHQSSLKRPSSFSNDSRANGVRRVTMQTSVQQHRNAAAPAAYSNEHEVCM